MLRYFRTNCVRNTHIFQVKIIFIEYVYRFLCVGLHFSTSLVSQHAAGKNNKKYCFFCRVARGPVFPNICMLNVWLSVCRLCLCECQFASGGSDPASQRACVRASVREFKLKAIVHLVCRVCLSAPQVSFPSRFSNSPFLQPPTPQARFFIPSVVLVLGGLSLSFQPASKQPGSQQDGAA